MEPLAGHGRAYPHNWQHQEIQDNLDNQIKFLKQLKMNKTNYPHIALAIAAVISFILYAASTAGIRMPLLAVLIMCEFGFLVSASGGLVAIKQLFDHGFSSRYLIVALISLLLAVYLGITGYSLWVSINA